VKGDAVAGLLAWSELDLGQSGVVVDGDVRVRPASVTTALQTIIQDALADLPEATQLLDIEVHQLADGCVLLPVRRWPRLALGT
jgi:hypothetical protein